MTARSVPEIQVRPACPDDAPALLAIFSHYIRKGTVSFEYSVPSISDFQNKITQISSDYPFLVAVAQDTPVGYCYASRFRGPAAYDWSAETTIYLDPAWHGHGIGRRLYDTMQSILTRQHVVMLYACISAEHSQSVGFHAHLGFRETARFHRAGFKMGKWLDIVWMEKRLSLPPINPNPFIPYKSLTDAENAE
ncbi:MAG: GNAT family N-acetyltransferase [Eubacteriales bacterium]|nr:GNAT family N-acetyltransferase [Eubacteriales bacterium]